MALERQRERERERDEEDEGSPSLGHGVSYEVRLDDPSVFLHMLNVIGDTLNLIPMRVQSTRKFAGISIEGVDTENVCAIYAHLFCNVRLSDVCKPSDTENYINIDVLKKTLDLVSKHTWLKIMRKTSDSRLYFACYDGHALMEDLSFSLPTLDDFPENSCLMSMVHPYHFEVVSRDDEEDPSGRGGRQGERGRAHRHVAQGRLEAGVPALHHHRGIRDRAVQARPRSALPLRRAVGRSLRPTSERRDGGWSPRLRCTRSGVRFDYEAMRKDPAPLPYLQQALMIAKFEPGMYEVIESYLPGGKVPWKGWAWRACPCPTGHRPRHQGCSDSGGG